MKGRMCGESIMNESFFTDLLQILREVGSYQLSAFRTETFTSSVKNRSEMVSEIDVESERRLHRMLTSLVEGSSFYGEETVQERGDSLTWVVDPIDGTANYISGYDIWTISTALVRGNSVEASMVYRPFTDEYFHAERGIGAWYQNRPLPKRPPGTLQDSLIGTGFPYRSPDSEEQFFSCAREMLRSCRGIRRGGSAALDLCLTAAGYLQGFWEIDLQPYDTAAGILMLQETGCRITDFFQRPFDLFSSSSLAAAPEGVHQQMCGILQRSYRSLDRIFRMNP